MAQLEIRNFTRQNLKVLAKLPFSKIAAEVLPDWDISLVFVGPTRAQKLNVQLRGKSYIPNVLSYAVGKKSGEIIICPGEAAKQATAHDMSEREFLLSLFIHGLLHLKGWAHGVKMERCEDKLLANYGAKNSHGNRHRHVPDKDGRRRGARR